MCRENTCLSFTEHKESLTLHPLSRADEQENVKVSLLVPCVFW